MAEASEGKGWTKGPWRLDGEMHSNVVDDNYHVIDGDGVDGFSLSGFMSAETAHLITAAPYLHETLEYMADLFKDLAGDQSTETGWKTDEMRDVWERAQDALRKAEGRIP